MMLTNKEIIALKYLNKHGSSFAEKVGSVIKDETDGAWARIILGKLRSKNFVTGIFPKGMVIRKWNITESGITALSDSKGEKP